MDDIVRINNQNLLTSFDNELSGATQRILIQTPKA
jgi:hypothetical protein